MIGQQLSWPSSSFYNEEQGIQRSSTQTLSSLATWAFSKWMKLSECVFLSRKSSNKICSQLHKILWGQIDGHVSVSLQRLEVIS